MKDFSILICSLEDRKNFLERLLANLNLQLKDNVEILTLIDNREKTIGQKRNELLVQAQGEYIAFIDDDDLVSDNYIELILEAIKTKPDVVGMHLLMTVDGANTEKTYHSLKYRSWYHEADPTNPGKLRYFRNPNHLNPVKREYALQVRFPEINNGEDRKYSEELLPFLHTEVYIEQPIYFYLYRSHK